MKICFKCGGEPQPLTAFYKHPQMNDGHLNKCKTCTKSDVKSNEMVKRQDPAWVEAENNRAREKYYRLEYREKHKPSPDQKKEAMSNYVDKYPEKQQAKNLSQRVKRIVKGNHLHHWSYQPEYVKDVIELAPADHATIHRFLVYDEILYMYRRIDNNALLDSRAAHQEWVNEILSTR